MQQTSTARKISTYDLGRFEQPAPKITPLPRKEHIIHPLKILFAAVVLVSMVGLMLYGRVQITERGTQINAQSARLEELTSEKVRMQTELESLMSLKNVEDVSITEYGMVKPDASQVTYLQVQQNRVETAVEEDTLLDKILALLEKFGMNF